MSKERYLSAAEAAAILGVNTQTLYAYVSRGLVRSEAGQGRQRRYRADDIQRLLARKELRRNPDVSTDEALYWGAPVMDSALTLIEEGRLYYRGRDVAQLSRELSFEQVCALLWMSDPASAESLFDASTRLSAHLYETILLHLEVDGAQLPMIQSLQTLLPIASANDPAAYDLRPSAVAQTGARILRLMVNALVDDHVEPLPIAHLLQRAWLPDDERAAQVLNAALIACADHELNASTFAARVAASASATPYAVVTAGLAVLSGVKHGGYTERVEALLYEVDSPAKLREALGVRLRRGDDIAGFGHHLYPQGDPRAKIILDDLQAHYGESKGYQIVLACIHAAADIIGERPALDFALVALARTLELPRGTALALFALGRAAGWLGHGIEQYATDRMIRPRARYTGELPH